MYRALAHIQINLVECLETTELHQYLIHLQQYGAVFLERSSANNCGHLINIWLRLRHGLALHTAKQAAYETNNAVLQVIHHKQGHQTEDGQTPVGDVFQLIGEPSHEYRRQHRHGHFAYRTGFSDDGNNAADRHDHGRDGSDLAKQVDIRQQAGQHHHDQRAEQGADTRLATAHDDCKQEQNCQFEVVAVGRNIFFRIRIQAAGEACQRSADDKGVDLVAIHRHTHAVGGNRTVTQGLEGASEMRTHNPMHHDQ